MRVGLASGSARSRRPGFGPRVEPPVSGHGRRWSRAWREPKGTAVLPATRAGRAVLRPAVSCAAGARLAGWIWVVEGAGDRRLRLLLLEPARRATCQVTTAAGAGDLVASTGSGWVAHASGPRSPQPTRRPPAGMTMGAPSLTRGARRCRPATAAWSAVADGGSRQSRPPGSREATAGRPPCRIADRRRGFACTRARRTCRPRPRSLTCASRRGTPACSPSCSRD